MGGSVGLCGAFAGDGIVLGAAICCLWWDEEVGGWYVAG